MQSVFLSQHFEEKEADLVEAVSALIESYDLLVVRGDALGGAVVREGVQKRIQSADAFVALATPVTGKQNGKTHPWVEKELAMARGLRKRAIALVQKGVKLKGVFAENERIDYDPARPLPALKKLAATMRTWRKEAGSRVRAFLLPPDAANAVTAALRENGTMTLCQYRFYDDAGRQGPWHTAALVAQQGGPMLYLNGVPKEALVEVKVTIGKRSWSSAVAAPIPHFTFQEAP